MHSSDSADPGHFGGNYIDRMRYSQFRVASTAAALAIAGALLSSRRIQTQLSDLVLAVCILSLLPCFAMPLAPRRAFNLLIARPLLMLVPVAGIALARFCFTSPNTLYMPAIVLAFVLTSVGTMRLVRIAAAVELVGGLVLIAVVRYSGQLDAAYDKLIVTYGLCAAVATYFVGLITLEFPDCLRRVEQLLSVARKPDTSASPALPAESRTNGTAGVLVSGLDVTPGQARVVEVLIEGATNDEIAERLAISVRTVQGHIRGALSRTGFTSRTQLAVAAALVTSES